jgi:hypothetical protein
LRKSYFVVLQKRGFAAMLNKINAVDWKQLGNERVGQYMSEALSDDEAVSRTALIQLKEAIAPWELLDGYGSTSKLMGMSKSALPITVIPLLVELLSFESVNKPIVLETLYDVARYRLVDESFVPDEEAHHYQNWAERLFLAVKGYSAIFTSLLGSDSEAARETAKDLLALLEDQDSSSNSQV